MLPRDMRGQYSGSLGLALQHYFKISSNEKPSRMKVSSTILTDSPTDLETMISEHDKIIGEYHLKYNKISWDEMVIQDFSFLDLKIKIAEKLLEKCVLCEKKCKIDCQFEIGSCQVVKPIIASEFLHMGEEKPLVPSHTIFFSGCNFICSYCQNWDISQNPSKGMMIDPVKLGLIIDLRRKQGSMNVNFVGGEPTPNLHYIMETMRNSAENIPVIWNSNLYLSEIAMKLLDGFADIYITDFKYGNDKCAEDLSGISDYTEILRRNHKIAQKSGDMIIRHLILPNHVECCSKPIIKWISNNLGLDVVLNIMSQYKPAYKASEHSDISRLPTTDEVDEVVSYAETLGFVNLI